MFKRIFLFVLLNIVIIATIEFIMMALNIDPSTINDMGGFNYEGVAAASLLYGFVGSIISLLLSRPLAKMMCGVSVIKNPTNPTEVWLLNTIEHYTKVARIPMPEVGIYHGSPNAFATGWSKDHSLVAVSDGLLQLMDEKETAAVICHELSHIKNGDMVTMCLLQGVMNAFIIFLSRLLSYIIMSSGRNRNSRRASSSGVYYLVSFLLRIILGIVASLILCFYSRKREYAADKGASDLMCEPMSMISALSKLGGLKEKSSLPKDMAAFGISGDSSFLALFATHPPIANRISALKKGY